MMKHCLAALIALPLLAQVPELRLAEPRVFRQRELIRIDIAGLPDGPWHVTKVLIDPPPDEVPAAGRIRNGLFSPGKPGFLLSDHAPVLAPGTYRVSALVGDKPTNAILITIQPSDREWTSRKLSESVKLVRAGQAEARDAAVQLQLLDEPAAWRASLDLLPLEEGTLLTGFMQTSEPAKVCQLLQNRIPAPEQSVSTYYLQTIVQTCARVSLPAPPRLPAGGQAVIVARLSPFPPPAQVSPAPVNKEMAEYAAKRQAFETDLMAKTTAVLAGSLAPKQPEPKVTAFATLLEYLRRQESPPEWAAGVHREFVRSYPSFDVSRQRYLLDLFGSAAPPGLVTPLLEATLDSWKPGDYNEAAHTAIRTLSRLDPARARVRLLAELIKPKTWLDANLLALLPAADVPPMDDALLALAHDTWNMQLRRAAIAKYASPRVVAEVKAIQESDPRACQPELAAYFLRVDPDYADQILHNQPSDMQTMPPPCTIQYFERTASIAMHPVLEKYTSAYLMHGVVFVKMLAARSLGKYGSPAVREPLWGAYRYFHEYWNGKAQQLEQNGEGVVLEVELRNALARGTNWLTTEAELTTIESLCISSQCRSETQGDLRSWQQPRLELYESPLGIHGSVGHYLGLQSLAAMRSKLAQFPSGSTFLASRRAIAEFGTFAREQGIQLVAAGY
jgi:hypothetical protein